MAKRSILGKIYSEYKQDKRQRERLEVQLYRDDQRARLQADRARELREDRDRRANEREEAARQKREAAARDDRQRAAASSIKAPDAKTLAREQKAQHVERQSLLAVARSEAVAAHVAQLLAVVRDRDQTLLSRQAMAASAAHAFGPTALERSVRDWLMAGRDGKPHLGSITQLRYQHEVNEVHVDCELPRRLVVPDTASYRYVKSRDVVEPVARPPAEVRAIYADLIARVALRTIREVLDCAPADLVAAVVFNGHVSAVDPSTGHDVRPCVLSVVTSRDAFNELRLDVPEFRPVECLRGPMRAVVSPHPYDLEPVRPVVEFDRSRYKFIDGIDVLADLDSRLDVLALSPTEFEHLVRQLVEAMGLDTWVTQASNDDGVDAVANNPKPIIGGLCIIQAKRYKRIVTHESVQALAGVIDDKRASRGILITTSWVGHKSHEFARRHGRMEIYDGRHLKSLLAEYLGVDALVKLPVVPKGWTERDIA